MYEAFFDITVTLCERFPDLNPIKVRKYPAHEVFLLIKRLSKYNAKQKTKSNTVNNSGVIRKKAGDDWF